MNDDLFAVKLFANKRWSWDQTNPEQNEIFQFRVDAYIDSILRQIHNFTTAVDTTMPWGEWHSLSLCRRARCTHLLNVFSTFNQIILRMHSLYLSICLCLCLDPSIRYRENSLFVRCGEPLCVSVYVASIRKCIAKTLVGSVNRLREKETTLQHTKNVKSILFRFSRKYTRSPTESTCAPSYFISHALGRCVFRGCICCFLILSVERTAAVARVFV